MKTISDTPFTSVRQIGLVTGNIDRFMQNMRDLYSLEADRTAFVPTDATKETCLRRLAFYDFPEVQLEVVEPLRSHPAWHEFLNKHGDCLQHMQFNVDNLAEVIQRMEARGVTLIERGYSIMVPEVEYAFFDTVAMLGYVTEVVNFREIENRKKQERA